MAKGNLFQGMARGKIGDVVFYRMNGVQMSRVRNRTPKNPRTNEQLYQRAVIATVMKAYSAGKEIFDHAFQGYTIGEGCMRRFNSVNARIMRNGLMNELNMEPQNCTYSFVAPRALYPVPCAGLQISEGTLINNLFVTTAKQEGKWFAFKLADNTSGATTVKDYLNMKGTYAGDIYTFVAFHTTVDRAYNPQWATNDYQRQFVCLFEYIRMIIKSDISDTLTLEQATYGDIFEIELGGVASGFDETQKFTPGTEIQWKYPVRSNDNGSRGCIRSRLDADIRSTAYLVPSGGQQYGLRAPYVLEAWQNEIEKIGVSELILEGGDGPSGVPATLEGLHEVPVVISTENENPVPTMARHRGTRNNKK